MIRRIAVSILVTASCLVSAFAADGLHYVNAWYRYAIDLPQGFSAVKESHNGDGGFSYSADRKSKLAVWGVNAILDSFKLDVENRIQSAEQDGWTITYRKMTSRWASWSGERQGRIVYGRSIRVCDDGVAAFELEYPQDAKDAFDPVVNNLVQSFKPTSCDG
jgi:hypothetical protein